MDIFFYSIVDLMCFPQGITTLKCTNYLFTSILIYGVIHILQTYSHKDTIGSDRKTSKSYWFVVMEFLWLFAKFLQLTLYLCKQLKRSIESVHVCICVYVCVRHFVSTMRCMKTYLRSTKRNKLD